MENEQLQKILQALREQAAKNPYFVFVYDWGIVNLSPEIATATEIMHCIETVQFPPIGKN